MRQGGTLLENAKEFANILTQKYTKNQDCLSVLSFIAWPSVQKEALRDALIITLTAETLDCGFSEQLMLYFRQRCTFSDSLEQLQASILKGVYLFIWSRNKSILGYFMDGAITELIQSHLNVKTFEEISKDEFNQSINLFRNYTSFIFDNKKGHQRFAELNERLGDDIQTQILELQYVSRVESDNVLNKTYHSLRSYWGFN